MLSKLFQRPNCLLNQRNRNQFLATVIINIICIAHGFGIGWLSPTLRRLQSPDTPLDFEMGVNEVSWVGSALGLGSMLGNILTGLLINYAGAKFCLFFLTIPHTCLWILVYFANRVEFLIVGRFMAGITGGGVYIVHPIFLSEISDANVRGTFASMVMLCVNIGILTGYIIGMHFSYHTIPFIALIFPCSYFLCVLLFIRDSPMHLIRKGKIMAAEQSFRYYKNIKDSDSLSKQTSELAEFENAKLTLSKSDNMSDKISLRDFFTKAAVRGYGMAAILIISNQFSGIFTMLSYMSTIFALSGSTMDPNSSAIIIGVVQILGAYLSTLLCDVFGRRILILVSSAGVAISLTGFGLFAFYAQQYDLTNWSWTPVALMALDIFLGNLGLASCLFVLMVEMFPLKLRARATAISVLICSAFVFLMLNIFPLCMAYWGLPATMWSCAGITALCFVCFYLFLKETKGKSMLED